MINSLGFFKKNIIMCIAFFAALITIMFVPLSKEYYKYIDFKTITCLFCTLAVVCALRNIYFFQILSRKIVFLFKDTRSVIIVLIYVTLIGSMFIANDMALITFLPLGFFVLEITNNRKYLSFVFIMQNIAANLGGMLTPFGNPQNLYLYNRFNIPNKEFIQIMFLPFILSIILITLSCLSIKAEPLSISISNVKKLNKKLFIIYSVLFFLSIALVFNIIPYYYGLIIIVTSLLILDRKALKSVDYPLLLTFVFFFIFSGNMSKLPLINIILKILLEKNTLFFSVLSCQFISNVPSAILLSNFTNNYRALLVGVNIGGVGTPIASLASLITLKEYLKCEPTKIKHYLSQFLLYNFSILIILLMVMLSKY